MRPSMIPLRERIRERVNAFVWNRKYKEDLKKIREALLKSDFNDGSNVEWEYDFYTWKMSLKDKEGYVTEISTAWRGAASKHPLKIYGTHSVYDKSHSIYYEINLNTLLTGSIEEINEHVRFIKNELQEQPKIEKYFIDNVGKMNLMKIRYLENEKGKNVKVMAFYLGGHVNGWKNDKESFTTRLVLDDKDCFFGGDVLDTEVNRSVLTHIVEGYGEGEYEVRKFKVHNKESNGIMHRIIEVVEIQRTI